MDRISEFAGSLGPEIERCAGEVVPKKCQSQYAVQL
jgi:hypothetical protein